MLQRTNFVFDLYQSLDSFSRERKAPWKSTLRSALDDSGPFQPS
jgi:hypothetical protein